MSASSGPYSLPGVTGATSDLTDAELIATDVRAVIAADTGGIHPFRSDDLAVLMAEYDRRGAALAAARKWDAAWSMGTAGVVEGTALHNALAAAATPAPPVDVAARLRAVVKILDGSEPYVGRGREIQALSRMADYIEADPDDAEVQAIARALTGEATDA